jgi:hypothetical protein
MRHPRLAQSALALLIGPFALACSSDAGGPGDDTQSLDPGDDDSLGDGGPVYEPGNGDQPRYFPTAQRCPDLNSGHDGDDFCILPPDPEVGFQLHYGPTNYDDPEEVANFLIYPGEEYVDCIFRKTPNTEEKWSGTYHGRLRPGSHHMITYLQGEQVPDNQVPTQDCRMGVDFTFFVGATTQRTDIGVYDELEAPEDEGLGLHIPPRAQTVISLHYVNTTTQPILKESWINAIYLPREELRGEVQPITWIGGIAMNVPPQSTQIIQGGATAPGGSCTADVPETRILQLVAHAHANTQRVAAFIKRPGDAERQLIYETYDWHDPGFLAYNTKIVNAAPNPAAGTVGGVSGLLFANPGDELSWECEVVNEFDDIHLTFADRAYDGEMCNMFGVYKTDLRTPWRCFTM